MDAPKVRWLSALALIGVLMVALPAGASTQRQTLRYRIVRDQGDSVLVWKITSGDRDGSKGTGETEYSGKGSGIFFINPGGGGTIWGGGAAGSRLAATDTFTTTDCLDGTCDVACTKKKHAWRAHGWIELKIVKRGKAVKVTWNYPTATTGCTTEVFLDVFTPKPQVLPLSLFKRQRFTLRTHGATELGGRRIPGANGVLTWDWRMTLVRKS